MTEASAKSETRDDRSEFVLRLPNLRAWLDQQLPDEFKTHMRAARREQLLAMRSLIDAAIERIDDDKNDTRASRRVEIAVE